MYMPFLPWVSRSIISSLEMEPWNHSLPRLGSSSLYHHTAVEQREGEMEGGREGGRVGGRRRERASGREGGREGERKDERGREEGDREREGIGREH